MATLPNLLEGCAIRAKGLISEVQHYENKDKKHYYSFILIIPGSSPLKIGIKAGGDPSEYRDKIGSPYTCNISVRETKFGFFFEEL